MQTRTLTRRAMLAGSAAALGGCSAIAALNTAAVPLDTYDLAPAAGASTGPRSTRTLLVARPEAPAAIATDRIMVKPDAISITYLPDARWSDELPLVVQTLLVRSIAGTGRLGYVGRTEGGPVPDAALLTRIDGFQTSVQADGTFRVAVELALTIVNDRDQRVLATRGFSQAAVIADDSVTSIVAAFQGILDVVLPAIADWAAARV